VLQQQSGKLETSLYRCKKYFVILNRLAADHHDCDGQTGRENEWPLAMAPSNVIWCAQKFA